MLDAWLQDKTEAMKFAQYLKALEFDAPPEWRGKFIGYKRLKKELKNLRLVLLFPVCAKKNPSGRIICTIPQCTCEFCLECSVTSYTPIPLQQHGPDTGTVCAQTISTCANRRWTFIVNSDGWCPWVPCFQPEDARFQCYHR